VNSIKVGGSDWAYRHSHPELEAAIMQLVAAVLSLKPKQHPEYPYRCEDSACSTCGGPAEAMEVE
jgi:hypothetical protein